MNARRDLLNLEPNIPRPVDLASLAEAIEAAWDRRTAYQGTVRPGNPAFGRCYPTARVVQWFYPEMEIAKGEVWTGYSIEHHFWNVRGTADDAGWIDLSWKQFPAGSVVRQFDLLDRHELNDSAGTQVRCALLLDRVLDRLGHPKVQRRSGLSADGGSRRDICTEC